MVFNLQKLRYERMSRKFSQEDMAEKIGMSRTSYWKRENGTVPITIDEFIKILNALDIPESESINFFTHNVDNREQKTS